MAARRTKSGRFSKRSTTRRRRKPKTNLIDVGVSALVANAVTTGLFNTNIVEFMTGTVNGKYKPGADGSWVITLPELLGAGPGPIGGMYGASTGGFTGVVSHNFKKNWMPMLGQVIFVPVIAKAAQKVLRRPVLTPANKLIKMTGLDVKV